MFGKSKEITRLKRRIKFLETELGREFNVGDRVWTFLDGLYSKEIKQFFIVAELVCINNVDRVLYLNDVEQWWGINAVEHMGGCILRSSGSVHKTKEAAIKAYNRNLEFRAESILEGRIEL